MILINITQNIAAEPFELDEAASTLFDPDIIIPDDYSTIQEGINHAHPGDKILVRPGVYKGNIVVDKEGLFIQGEDKFTTVIDGEKTTEDAVIISAQNVAMQGFTITNARGEGIYLWDQSGIKIFSSNASITDNRFISNRIGINVYTPAYNITISNNEFIDDSIILGNYFNSPEYPELTKDDFLHTIENNTVNGRPLYYYKNQNDFTVPVDAGQIILVNCSNISIRDMYMSRNDFSIILAYCTNCIVENMTISDNDGEILLFHSENNTIQNNTVSNTFKGVCLEIESKNNIVRYNDFSYNYVGISVFTSSSDNQIYRNHVHNNEGSGIEVISFHGGSQHDNIISENYIYNNKLGIRLQQNSVNNIIRNNTISKNSIGLLLSDSSNNNEITYNTFRKNLLSAVFIGCVTNTWNHNYWNRPRVLPKTIVGLRRVGKVSVPWINFDLHPAKTPY